MQARVWCHFEERLTFLTKVFRKFVQLFHVLLVDGRFGAGQRFEDVTLEIRRVIRLKTGLDKKSH